MVPDTARMAENLKVSLNAPQDISSSYMDLFDFSLTSINTNSALNAKKSYELLGVKYEPLKLIMPEFETPLPQLQPAVNINTYHQKSKKLKFYFLIKVFPPTFRELPAPPLELFDLDEAFSSEMSRMAQIANKCGENDLQYLISTAFEALGLQSANALAVKNEKEILYAVALEIATFKKQAEMPIDFL